MSENNLGSNYLEAKSEADKVDLEIIEALKDGVSFRVEAGAGSGKTYSLNKAIEWIQSNKWNQYRSNNQNVICITYTNAAVNVIVKRLSSDSFIIPSTIHSFAWSVIKQFQGALKNLISEDESLNNTEGDFSEVTEIRYTLGHRYVEDGIQYLHHSLVACSTAKNNDKSQSNNTADISDLMESEPSNLDDATALYKKLMQKENEILSSNSQLWEKVFMSANKDTSMIKDGTNYGDFLLNTIESGKDNFTADELKILKDGANQIKKIEDKLTTLEQKYPGCGSKPSEGESVDAESAGMVSDKSKLTKFPSFKGKDLDGNDVNSDDIFSSNNVTVINFWFTTCNPCVGELGDLEKLNKELAEKGGTVIGINSFTLDGDKTAISDAKNVLSKKGITYKNIWFDSKSEAGKFTSGLYSYPTTYVVDKNGNIVGQPIVGAITSSSQEKQLNKLIDEAIKNSKK